MPLLANAAGGPPVVVPPVVNLGPKLLGLTWVDPDGTAWNWMDRRQVFATNVAGLGTPTPAMSTLGLPSGGVIVQNYLPQPRTITVGLFAYNDDQAAWLALLDRISVSLWTVRSGEPAPGTLIVHHPDGSARQIDAFVTAGNDQSNDDNSKSGLTWSTWALTLTCPDPYWRDAEVTTLTFEESTAVGIPPMPPVDLAPATVLGNTTVTNTGDADAYPIWTIHGPGTPTMTNTTTGRVWSLKSPLISTDVWTIDTSPDGRASVTDQDGISQWAALAQSAPRDLWPLVPGVNKLDLALAGAEAGSKIELSYTPRRLRA